MAQDACAIALAGLVALAALRPLQDVPFVDDWTYAWSVEHLLQTGRLGVRFPSCRETIFGGHVDLVALAYRCRWVRISSLTG